MSYIPTEEDFRSQSSGSNGHILSIAHMQQAEREQAEQEKEESE